MKIRRNVGTVERYAYHRIGTDDSGRNPTTRPDQNNLQKPRTGNPGPATVPETQSADDPKSTPTYNEGFEAGVHDGYDKGFHEGAKATEQQLTSALEEHFNSLLDAMKAGADAIDKEGERLREQFEAWLPRAVLLVSEAVLQREVETNVATLIPVIQSCLADLPQGEPISVRLNPADHQVLAQQPEELWNNHQLTFVPDEAVSKGGALVEGSSRVVDARLESRLLEAARQLLFPQEGPADDSGAGGP